MLERGLPFQRLGHAIADEKTDVADAQRHEPLTEPRVRSEDRPLEFLD